MTWTMAWHSNFSPAVPLGKFVGCASNNVCTGLPAARQPYYWAYPNPWPDTATQRGYPVGGVYDPSKTIWIDGTYLNVKMFNQDGQNHVAAIVPKVAMNRLYGRYTETFRVVKSAPGFKSAHLLWPSNGDQDTTSFEVDFPENEWDTTISAFVHQDGSQQSFPTSAKWTSWHTSIIEWSPDLLTFYLDGEVVGVTQTGVPDIPMDWIIQNESALNGEASTPGSSAQIQWSHLQYDSYSA